MPTMDMSDLKKAAQAVAKSKTQEEKLKALSSAYLLFSTETLKLKEAYDGLKEQFAVVSNELEKSNSELRNKVIEFGLITEYLDTILIKISQGIIFLDLKGIITTFNPAAERILGVSCPVALFDPFWDNFEDDIFGFSMKESLKNQKCPENTFVTITPRNGEKRHLEINATYVDETGGFQANPFAIRGLIVLIRDITEIRQLQGLTLRNDRMKELGEMAASVAHEIRNPLGGIKGFASLLYRDLTDRPELQKMAKHIIEGTDVMNRLVTQVLHYARPVNPKLSPTNIELLIKDLIEHVKVDETLSRAVEIKTEIESPQRAWPLDAQLFRSCVLNLVVNSIQAMPKGGTITLKIGQEQNLGILKVIDTGKGIQKDHLEKIFSPFFTTRADGTGFGLSEVYKIVQAHGGSVEVNSMEGEGTTFIIKIPLSGS